MGKINWGRVLLGGMRAAYLLFEVFLLSISAAAFAQIAVYVSFGPPPIPVYEQPICPSDGYIWVPGYWAWDGYEYYWVPGTWVLPPAIGLLWTPGYWAWGGSGFFFHEGYWGPQVGFYGGINYGFGYFGHGYEGGRWDGGHFSYNREVNNVNVTVIHNVYENRVVYNNTNRVSYNGGSGGVSCALPPTRVTPPSRPLNSLAHSTTTPSPPARLEDVGNRQRLPRARRSIPTTFLHRSGPPLRTRVIPSWNSNTSNSKKSFTTTKFGNVRISSSGSRQKTRT